ncbi:hypothetical protein RM190_08615 [Paracoccus sp. CPCC 101403]|uniref:Uncharacterized protein n=1 Tax=Paracoccus broussonetiae TaxID=3075834 RepID=A0ABU3ECF9_9RHOB|nr:hypothetical protein [Paracoccus sp. CPCC 101403]MDT1061916.1 hypothetical protein [Paracoccus sp. CPCC 101403]
MTKAKDLFSNPLVPLTPWERTKTEALQILDDATDRRQELTASLKEARLAREAENPKNRADNKPKKKP